MLKLAILGSVSLVLFLVGDATPPAIDPTGGWLSPAAHLGAAGMMFYIVLQVLGTLKDERTAHQAVVKTIADQAHTDSVTLNETLTRLRENCAAVGKQPK